MPIEATEHSGREAKAAFTAGPAPTRPRERRRFKRLTTVMRARLFFLDQRIDAILLDVSVSGVKLRAEAPLPLGVPVTLEMADNVYFGGEVLWRQGPVVGIDFAKQPRQVARIMAAFLPAGHLLPSGRI
jgi:predicted O-methyltransferase YrrM